MLTLSQQRTYDFIKNYIASNQCSPTMAEIALGIGIKSRGVVYRYVEALANEGLIKLLPQRKRNIQLLEENQRNLLPLVGKIAAGSPIEAVPDNEAIDILNIFLGPKRYALKVSGDSMIEEGIFDGDVVVCEQANMADEGKIVVALIDQQEATLKRIHYSPDGQVVLIPANSKLAPMAFDKERVQVQGIYIGLLRFGAV